MPIEKEIVRKTIHLTMIAVPIGYTFFDKKIMLVILGVAIVLALLVEVIRFHLESVADLFNRFFGKFLRDHEHNKLTGATYLLIGSFFAILFFEKWIAIAVILFCIISDGLSALVGKLIGKRKVNGNKTLAGCLTFLITAAAIVLIFFKNHLLIGLSGAGVAFIVDVFIQKIDDNLTIPVIAGGLMQILAWGLL